MAGATPPPHMLRIHLTRRRTHKVSLCLLSCTHQAPCRSWHATSTYDASADDAPGFAPVSWHAPLAWFGSYSARHAFARSTSRVRWRHAAPRAQPLQRAACSRGKECCARCASVSCISRLGPRKRERRRDRQLQHREHCIWSGSCRRCLYRLFEYGRCLGGYRGGKGGGQIGGRGSAVAATCRIGDTNHRTA